MEFKIQGQLLAQALERVSAPVDHKAEKLSPALENVRLEAVGTTLKLATADLDVTAQYEVEAAVNEPGVALVNLAALAGIAKNSKLISLHFKKEGDSPARVWRGSSEFQLAHTAIELFPTLAPPITAGNEVEASIFNYLVERSAYAADLTKKYGQLTDSIHFEKEGDRLVAVATDCLRLAICRCPYAGEFKPMTVLKRVIETLYKTTRGSGTVRFEERDNFYAFEVDKLLLTVRKLARPYLSWANVRPDPSGWPAVKVMPMSLADAIGDVTIIKGDEVEFRIEKGGDLTLSEQTLRGTASARAEARLENANQACVKLNARQAADYLSALGKGVVRLEGELTLYISQNVVLFVYEIDDRSTEYVQSTSRAEDDD